MNQDADNWEILQSLFHLAEEHPEADLDALLLRACADAELRTRAKVLILLAREGATDPGADEVTVAPTAEQVIRRIGPYAIVRLLGSGGIGTVYLTERIAGGVVQRAAVKVLSQHAAGPSFAERFAREQHILASLDHPNITRMLDAGLSDAGEPYLVMEYVDGIHLDTYCDDRSLDIPARLKLYLQVCEAVAYAHRNLIVHLDLKPSNILVTADEGQVKLLDFGTSKLIQPDSLLTTTVMATPAYASPEQLRNDPVTTACDVYALGAILFEMLSGRRPNQDRSVAMMIERSIKELPPEPITGAVTPAAATHRGVTATRLVNLLRGDLATMVAKCLAPRPKDRYSTVDALITDIQRYLAGRPILARSQTTTYRLTKFVRRNRKAVITGVFAVLALLATSGYALWRQHQAVVAGQRAEQMQSFMYSLFKLANTNYMGKPTATVEDFLNLGGMVLPDFIKDPSDLRAAQLSLGESMFDNVDLKPAQSLFDEVIATAKRDHETNPLVEAEAFGGSTAFRLGDSSKGEALLADAVQRSHQTGVPISTRIWSDELYASAHWNLGLRSDKELKLLDEADRMVHTHTVSDRQLAWTTVNNAEIYAQIGRLEEAERLAQEALTIFKRRPYTVCDQADTLATLGDIRDYSHDPQAALAYYELSFQGFKTCQGAGSFQTLEAGIQVARAMIKLGRTQEAATLIQQELPDYRKAVSAPSDLNTPLIYLARADELNGHFEEAVRNAEEAYRVIKDRTTPSSQKAFTQFVWAVALQGQGKLKDALAHAELADATYAQTPLKSTEGEKRAAEAHNLLASLKAH